MGLYTYCLSSKTLQDKYHQLFSQRKKEKITAAAAYAANGLMHASILFLSLL
jgi:hypothetical protein